MNDLIGNPQPDPDSIVGMQSSPYTFDDTRWAAYQNHDLGSSQVGHLRFMAVGPRNTFKEAPERYPDTPQAIGWRYLHVGWVNLQTGKIES